MRSERALLIDIRDNIRLAQSFTAGWSFEQFDANVEKLYAVTRCLEIISEASRGIGSDLKQRHPHLLWADIAGAGNIYRHSYERISTDIVWGTVQLLAPLLVAVEAELARAG